MPFSGTARASGQMYVTELPGGKIAKTVPVGPYDELHQVYERLEARLKEHGHRPGGGPWESHVDDPSKTEPVTFVPKVYWPLEAETSRR